MPRRENVFESIGKKYGKLTVISLDIEKQEKGGRTVTRANCQCECGNTKLIILNSLKTGGTLSCGCYVKSEERAEKYRTHGMTKSRIYSIWHGMRDRCLNKNATSYHSYGGRGINVCEKWKSFENFRDWAFENGYSEELTIDRIDNNGNYEPSNCKWSTRKEQSQNRKVNIIIDNLTLSEYCKIHNLRYKMIIKRLLRGWDIEKAISTPPIVDRLKNKNNE